MPGCAAPGQVPVGRRRCWEKVTGCRVGEIDKPSRQICYICNRADNNKARQGRKNEN